MTKLREILAGLYLKCHVPPPHLPFKMNLLVVGKLFFIKVVAFCWKMGLTWLLPTWWQTYLKVTYKIQAKPPNINPEQITRSLSYSNSKLDAGFLNADEHHSKKQPPRSAREIKCLHLLFPHRNHSFSKNQTLLECLKWDTQDPQYLKPLDIL